jgi:hypothetical protein
MTNPYWRELRRQQHRERLRQVFTEHGLVESADADDGYGPAAGHILRERYPDLSADNRLGHQLCAFCLRTLRRQRITDAGYRLCPACAEQPQADPNAPGYWTHLARSTRRARIIARFNVDPATWRPSRFELTDTTVHLDADGVPSVVITRPTVTSVEFIGMPRMFWHLLEERGEGIATPSDPR